MQRGTDQWGGKLPCCNALGLGPDPAAEDLRKSELVRHPTKAGLCVPTSLLAKRDCPLEADHQTLLQGEEHVEQRGLAVLGPEAQQGSLGLGNSCPEREHDAAVQLGANSGGQHHGLGSRSREGLECFRNFWF